MDCKQNNITEATLVSNDKVNAQTISMTYKLSPEQLEFLGIVGDSVKSARGDVNAVPIKPVTIEQNIIDICWENAPTTEPSMAMDVQMPKIKVARMPYARRRMDVVKCGRILLLDALAESFRKAAIQRSLNVVLSFALPRQMNLLITKKHVEIIGSMISPVQLPDIISPRQIEGNPIEEISAGPIDMSGDNNDDQPKKGPEAKRKRRRFFSVFGRQLLKIGRRLFCCCGAPTSD